MPFGVTDGPSIFQRFMDTILAEHRLIAFWYIDDVLIFGATESELVRNTISVKRTLLTNGCVVNEEKSTYRKQSLLFAGLWVTPDTVGPNKEKIAELFATPVPKTKTDRQSALGLVSYLRDFIPLASILTASMNIPARDWVPPSEYVPLWNKLLNHISQFATTLGHFDETGPAQLYADASGGGCGAILIQNGKVISLVSRKFTATELGAKYDTTDRETLALLLAAERFKMFLHRPKGMTRVMSDHSALLNRKVAGMSPRQVRWHRRITTWISNLEHVKGKENPADFISRWPVQQFGGRIRV